MNKLKIVNQATKTTTVPVYADYNATSPLRPEAKHAMLEAMDGLGNASSVHQFGRETRKHVEAARQQILEAIGLPEYRLAFTSGATEALATVLSPGVQSLADKRHVERLLIAPTEHVAALSGHRFTSGSVEKLALERAGTVDLESLAGMLDQSNGAPPTMVAVHGANNETGVVQPLTEIAALCRKHNAILVSDMVQWAGRLPLGDARPAALIISGHKFGGPSGIGALIYDAKRIHITDPLVRGGGQERGLRAGTENPIGILGMAAALKAATEQREQEQSRLEELRDYFEAKLLELRPEAAIFGSDAKRLANTSCFAIPGKESALALMQLDLDGIALSSGSACSSGKVKESHVLAAMGVDPDLASCALRLSLGFQSTAEDIERILASIERWA